MRLLYTTSSAPAGLIWPALADEQIDCGPLHLDLDLEGQVFSRRTPVGDYDLAALIASLPQEQRPDIIVCVADGRTIAWPRNLAACRGPRLLLVGDSQNSPGGLAHLLAYARSEEFDRIVFTHGCLDEALFRVAGLNQTFWFPGLLCPIRDESLPIVRQASRSPKVLAPPASSTRYAALNVHLELLSRASIPVQQWSSHAETRLEQMGCALASLVPSERGEWDSAFFETLAAGGLLATGGLGAKAGLERLWPAGPPCAIVDGPETLAARIADWLDAPATTADLRAAGAAWYDRFLGSTPRRAAFAALAFEGRHPVPQEPEVTSRWAGLDPASLTAALPATAALHGALAAQPRPTAWLAADAPAACVAMCERFPRLQITRGTTASGRTFDFAVAASSDSAPGAAYLWLPSAAPEPAGREACGSVCGLSVSQRFQLAAKARAEAWEALEAGEYPTAMELARMLTAQRPEEIDGHLILADLLAEEGPDGSAEKPYAVARRLNAHDPRLHALQRRFAQGNAPKTSRRVEHLWRSGPMSETAIGSLAPLGAKFPGLLSLQMLLAHIRTLSGDLTGAIETWRQATRYHPNEDQLWFNLGLALWRAGRRDEAGFALRRAADHAPQIEAHTRAFETAVANQPSIARYEDNCRDLIVTSAENCRKHGVGVLIKRFFSSHTDIVTLRPATYYGGIEEVGGTHLCVPFEEFSSGELQTRLRRLLAPYTIRRILCVPFRREECIYAIAAQEVTGARLCTYVMDDRNVLINGTEDHLLEDLFRRSSLRLAISPELQMAYTIKYDYNFELMPPIVSNRDARRKNRWTPKIRPATHAALIGNIWTAGQLNQLIKFVARSGLTIDWFGNAPEMNLKGTGINAVGFADENILAQRLTEYPFVVIPSGTLDGSEDDEWLTRLSLPSRTVFLLQTQTPVLVLGSKDTCVGRHVMQLGIGRVIPYNHSDPASVIREMTTPAARVGFLANALRAADGFVMPESGRWIWDSLDAGTALPAPFHAFLGRRPEFDIVWPPSSAGKLPISPGEFAVV